MENDLVLVDLVFRPATGHSLSEETSAIKAKDLSAYAATKEIQEHALQELRHLGFTIVGPATAFGVTVSASHQLVQQVFGEGELKVPDSLASWISAARIPPSGEYYRDNC